MILSRHPSTVLSAINESTKWTISSASILFLFLKHDASVMWCLLGSLTSLLINKALKLLINDRRPAYARKSDPGMPSTHSNGLGFLATYICISLCLSQQAEAPALWPPSILASMALVLSAFLAWLRVALGYHTYPQMVVGYLVGSVTAAAWHNWGAAYVLQALEMSPLLYRFLLGLTWASGAVFAFKALLPILKEFLRKKSVA
ncbi:hypothetical protein CEUSTIGMA_g8378.t1 [Chlamydomonas eustigma]|uniref:Phosphatidic acid phosphatase type 2/haloperoxidase domain-containing protein n=1 Tax=Chlamydomonas eustigma TaxID=1157962 RepID=A0A250XCY0_9CHLO|nr:hypothetical protein CEUSTIGMA_g8378.t1 [Chlamydomonas eustigma]|eukprot:GAX80943.1 hypothetical protein CEUSTIGMA_g8378.t1 [Chlamydomonas eustigma]